MSEQFHDGPCILQHDEAPTNDNSENKVDQRWSHLHLPKTRKLQIVINSTNAAKEEIFFFFDEEGSKL